MNRIVLLLSFSLLLISCKQAHLDIFPELADPSLVDRKLTIEEMKEDIDALIEGAILRHPDLSAYADIDKLKTVANKYKSELKKDMTRVEFYQVIGKLSHHFNDGHSFLIWPYQEFTQLKKQGHRAFPLEVVIKNNSDIHIKHTYKSENKSIFAGSEILSINGVSSLQLVAALQQYTGGETRHLREQIVARRFSTVLWAALGFIDTFEIELLSINGKKRVVQISEEENWQLTKQSSVPKAHHFRKINSTVGVLYLAHFDIDPDEFELTIDKIFAKIQKQNIETLIIDIRDNPGGNTDTVTYLARYLASKPFRLVSSIREKLYKENRGILNYKGEIGEVLAENWDKWEKPVKENRFTGKAYLLISPISYSAAIVLATTLKDNEFAMLVGETTGGFANQTAQGNLFNLPNSQLRAYIATRMLVRPNEDLTRKGVEPDHQVQSSVADIQAQRDAAIEFILTLEEAE